MCGIVGSVSFNDNFRITEEFICRMRDAMVHRGPDGAGVWVSASGNVGLGHRRLSIVDLSDAAAQPMCNEDGSIWLSFNGEIYNQAEIRRELESTGQHRWITDHCDTEVIVHAFEQWGIDCIQRFRGMFAFALWDQRSRELWLVRDRIGIKPLYYSVHHGRITFASEIKALLQDSQQERVMNEEAIYHFLSFLTTPAPDTAFRGIHKLPAGCWLRVRADGTLVQQRYWDVWDHASPLSVTNERQITEMLLEELRISVRLRKMSDVPVGVFLSGGIDSSTNAALFSEGASKQVSTFSIGYQGEYGSYRNELPYARSMADRVGAKYHESLLSSRDLLDFLPQMIRLQDEPIADPVCVPLYYVSKLARDNGVIVCQLGEGSDELFWGYESWKKLLRAARLNDITGARAASRLALSGLRAAGHDEGFQYELLWRASQGLPVFWSGYESFTQVQKQRLLSSRLKKSLSGLSSWEPLRDTRLRFEQKAWQQGHLSWMTYADLNLRLPELLLMRVDKMSMGVSLEARVPFLDHKFVELAMSIPESLKTRNGTLKYILKKAVRGLIPDELIDRRKQGFGVPLYEWMLRELGQTSRSEILNFCDETDLFDRSAIEQLLSTAHRSKRDAQQVWILFNLAMWWREYIASPSSQFQAGRA
ncbi:MAG TPA: asparagine synthase (glutamine-hydrolyzing) [Terriglobales bacterium]|nr:asparagine synthase (glutamine-hydrolyzing) [Terriglobales bacterium]